MASLERRGNSFRLIVVSDGKKIRLPIGRVDEREAEEVRLRFERRHRLWETGAIEPPDGADLHAFLLHDKKVPTQKKKLEPILTLSQLFKLYRDTLPEGGKEATTQKTERTHQAHLERILGRHRPAASLKTSDVQYFIDQRSKEKGAKGGKVSHVTIRREIGTFQVIMNWAFRRELIPKPISTLGLIYAKRRVKLPFQTTEQIERQIQRGGLTDREIDDLWDSVFLTTKQIADLLAYVQANDTAPFVYPMFVFAAMTGARRSEMMRSRIDDFDFEGGFVRLREKKKDTSRELTFRSVPMTSHLRKTMHDWFEHHPGGQYTLTFDGENKIGTQTAARAFWLGLRGSTWAKLRGWHMFRHSFCSNCAAAGLDQRLINEWAGHQTDEMVRRYRHLFPDQQQQALATVFEDTFTRDRSFIEGEGEK